MAWASESIAVYGDVRERYENVGDLTDDKNTVITSTIAKAKAYIGRKLDLTLKSKHALRDYSETDLKELISNPSVLKYACVAWTLKLLFEDNSFNDEDFNYIKMKDFEREFKDEFSTAVQLIEFDEDESGDISDKEKAGSIGATGFFRV